MLIMIRYKTSAKQEDLSDLLGIVEPLARKKGFTTISNSPKMYYNKNATDNIAMDLIKNIKSQLVYGKVVDSIQIGKLRKV